MRTLLPAVLAAVALTGCNEPPLAPVVGIEPAEPGTSDTLRAVILTESTDPNNNDEVTYAYQWSVDGNPVPEATAAEVGPDLTTRGETWSVVVTPSDDKLPGESATAAVSIINTPPTATVTIEPADPLSDQDLVAVITPDDVDGDTVNATYSWTVDGEDARLTTNRVPGDRTVRGETWEVTVVPSDAREDGEPVTASVQVANQAPVVESVRIRPNTAREGSVLTLLITASDYDGDRLTYIPTWQINGVDLAEVTELELDGTHFDRGDTVTVSIVANDGLIDSAPVSSDGVEIVNTPPTLESASITPTEAGEGDVLTCTATGWSDVDGDPETLNYEWRIDATQIGTGVTIDGEFFDKGDRVACAITPFDGIESGPEVVSRPIVIENTPPSLSTLEIGPEDPATGTAILSTATGLVDVDGDPIRLDIDWYVDGSKVASGASLAGTAYVKEQDIYAEATPYDGTDFGTAVKSNTITSVNAQPEITTFALDPATVYTNTNIGLSIVTYDADFDTVSLDYDWTLNGSAYGSSTTTMIPSSEFARGDTFAVTVTPNDGTTDGASESASGTVQNSPPTEPGISLSPSRPDSDDDLLCNRTSLSTDADLDTLTYTWSWKKDGVAWTGGTATTTNAGDTIRATNTSDGDKWECTISVSDGIDTSTNSVTADLGGYVAGFSGEVGPIFSGWDQCEGYLDKSTSSSDIPADWGDDCEGTSYSAVRLVCGSSTSTYRYIEVDKNVFKDGLTSYPATGLISESKNQSGTSFTVSDQIYFTSSGGTYRAENGRSWWGGGSGCGESNTNITINNICSWEASNCFGQGLTGDRYLWVYVQ